MPKCMPEVVCDSTRARALTDAAAPPPPLCPSDKVPGSMHQAKQPKAQGRESQAGGGGLPFPSHHKPSSTAEQAVLHPRPLPPAFMVLKAASHCPTVTAFRIVRAPPPPPASQHPFLSRPLEIPWLRIEIIASILVWLRVRSVLLRAVIRETIKGRVRLRAEPLAMHFMHLHGLWANCIGTSPPLLKMHCPSRSSGCRRSVSVPRQRGAGGLCKQLHSSDSPTPQASLLGTTSTTLGLLWSSTIHLGETVKSEREQRSFWTPKIWTNAFPDTNRMAVAMAHPHPVGHPRPVLEEGHERGFQAQ